mmetsp:Transcript_32112/g.44518  ORF Transcript_32112/g.44518 Transcript_32112/m.44518 type:complete len:411 (+) Transcript_32112:80-1312(+)|eukprot:CAMPEP_0196587106 /NCGR_PEP_ID=MMETSP1081-20130531/56472_1 /TAXON_ID=36882 /ORGANISM="Pyramimonas amylifera, Strain CCMP720" /LENGTH=410 /DNA_ID=CAMNT_0041909201 /DNA_START=75 /DNA_END=1307 /DNA_ORIENTATION=-
MIITEEECSRQDDGRNATNSMATQEQVRPESEEAVVTPEPERAEPPPSPSKPQVVIHDKLERKIAELEDSHQLSKGKSKVKVSKVDKQDVLNVISDVSKNCDEKVAFIMALIVPVISDAKLAARELQAVQRSVEILSKEKEKILGELSRVNALKGKLEALCRELQKQNKLIQDESKRASQDEQAKREELSTRFQETVTEINTRLESQGEDRSKQVDENEALRLKLVEFAERLDAREALHLEEAKAKGLEAQLAGKRLEQERAMHQETQIKAKTYAQQAVLMKETEVELRSQLNTYRDKFGDFESMIKSSHEAFTTFKTDIEKMSKRIKKLESEKAALVRKTQASDVAVIDLVSEKASLEKAKASLETKNTRLQALCRELQTERKAKQQSEQSQEESKEKENPSEEVTSES